MEGASEKKVSREWATPSPSPGDTSIGSRHPHPSAQTVPSHTHTHGSTGRPGKERDRACAHPPRKPDGELDDHPQPIHCLGVPPSQAPSHLGPHPPWCHQPHLPAALRVSEQLRFGDRQVAKAAVTVAATGV